MTTPQLPFLHGIKAIEFAGLAPVPFCGLLLADFGANVTIVNNKSGTLASFNQRLCRGKTQLWLDFKSPNDKECLWELCNSADVLLDPYRPGTLEHLGLDPNELLKINPKLIIARLTGFGQTGPLAARAGHDINYVALSGLLPTIAGKQRPDPPWPPANLLADFGGGGLLAAFGIVCALQRRNWNGGKGCVLDCSMTEGTAYLGTFVSLYRDQAWMWDDQFALFAGKCPFYRCYETLDRKWMAVGALEAKFREELFKTLELPEIPEDASEMTNLLERLFRRKSQAEWTETFRDKDACVTPVLDMDKELGHFEQHRARNSFAWDPEKRNWVPRPVPVELATVSTVEREKLKAKL